MARKSLEKLEQEHSQDQPAPEQPEQETAAGGFTESDTPATDEEAAETIADITKLLLQHEEIVNSQSYRENDLYAEISELDILAKRHSRIWAIKCSCTSAKKEATALYEITGSPKYAELADKLAAFEERLSELEEIEKKMPSVEQLSETLQNIGDASLAVKIQNNVQTTFFAIESIAASLKEETYQAIKESASKLSEAIEETAMALHSIIPSKNVIPNNSLINHLQQTAAINVGKHDFSVSNAKKNRSEILAVVQVDYDEEATGVKLITPYMTEYERQVINALCSLWMYGNEKHVFTPDMVYRTMTGQGSRAKVTSGQKSAITRAIHKWENTKITLDFSEETRKRKYTNPDGTPIDGYARKKRFLHIDEITVTAGGETVCAWQLTEEPIILQYCKLSGQFLTLPSDLLDIKDVQNGVLLDGSISNNEDRIAVKGNLLRRIFILKYYKKNKMDWNSKILFDTVFCETGLSNASRDKRSDMYSYIKQCLEFWKAKKCIAGYSMIKSGMKITGVNISL